MTEPLLVAIDFKKVYESKHTMNSVLDGFLVNLIGVYEDPSSFKFYTRGTVWKIISNLIEVGTHELTSGRRRLGLRH